MVIVVAYSIPFSAYGRLLLWIFSILPTAIVEKWQSLSIRHNNKCMNKQRTVHLIAMGCGVVVFGVLRTVACTIAGATLT
jgi:hypothetical protein